MNGYFITGTDTDIGKTTVGVSLLSAGARRGLRVAGLKPVESGCERGADGQLHPADASRLSSVSDPRWNCLAACCYRFEAAVAPGVAADDQGVVIDFGTIRRHIDRLLADKPDLLLVEGAGGLLVPMGGGRTIAALARIVAMPLLIVASPGLGTINHTTLSVRVARSEGLEVAGFVFCQRSERVEPLLESNAREIERAEGVRYLGCLPYLSGDMADEGAELDREALASAAETGLQLDRLLG